MKIGLIEGVVPHSKDAEITKAVKAAKRKLGGGSDSVAAFKNEAGKVYRYEVINSMLQEMYLAERLEPLGLVDETMQGARKPKGVWVLYGGGRDMSLTAMLAEVAAKGVTRKAKRLAITRL